MTISISGDGNRSLLVRAPYNEAVVKALRGIPNRSWSAEKKLWIIPDTPFHGDLLLSSLFSTGLFDFIEKPEEHTTMLSKLYDAFHRASRARHFSLKTESSYMHWVRRFIDYHKGGHPENLSGPHINAFLTHLATRGKVSASTQNQALSALLFLYRHVLEKPIDNLGPLIRANKPKRLPVVLSREEVRNIISTLSGERKLIVSLLYGTGMRLMECLRLRVKDIDLSRNEILIRDGKGSKDRRTVLPESLKRELAAHLKKVESLHKRDLEEGWGKVCLPQAIERKYPNAPREWAWQWVFPQIRALEKPQNRRRGTPSC